MTTHRPEDLAVTAEWERDKAAMEAAAWEGLATNPAAQIAAEGHDTVARWLFQNDQVAIGRERLHFLEQRADRNPSGGHLALLIRDLMDAAGFEYDSASTVTDQAATCAALIHDHRARADDLALTLEALTATHRTEVQRLTDLVTELRRQLEAAHRRLDTREGEAQLGWASQPDLEARP